MCLTVKQRCRCWEVLGVAAGAAFAVLEHEGYHDTTHRHLTLSRKFGRRIWWLFPVAGSVMGWHLLTLPDIPEGAPS